MTRQSLFLGFTIALLFSMVALIALPAWLGAAASKKMWAKASRG